MMFEEAAQFAVHLRRMESNIKKLQHGAEGMSHQRIGGI